MRISYNVDNLLLTKPFLKLIEFLFSENFHSAYMHAHTHTAVEIYMKVKSSPEETLSSYQPIRMSFLKVEFLALSDFDFVFNTRFSHMFRKV